MLRIRLSRIGKRNKAQFRVTVAEARRSPGGRFIEILGYYNPHTKEKVFKEERIKYWLSKGAKPSATIHNFLVDAGIIKEEKVISWKPKKKEEKKEQKEQKTSVEVKVSEKKEGKKEEAEAKQEDKKNDKEKEKKEEVVKPKSEAEQKAEQGRKQKVDITEKNKKT